MTKRRFFDWSKCLALAVVLVSLLVLVIPASVVTADSVVTFPDANLEAAIRVAIEKPTGDIYESDLGDDKLTHLLASDMGIVNLSGMEHIPVLAHLELQHNQISDIWPLSDTAFGDYILLDHNQISDISPLAEMSLPETLSLDHNQISNISSLASVSLPRFLDLSYNQISSISSLASVSLPEFLDLSYNQISNVEPLVNNLRSHAAYPYPPTVNLRGNPLDSASINTHIPALIAMGVTAEWDAPVNQPPERPVSVSPTNGVIATGQGLTPKLQAKAFSDPDGDTHAASQWQVTSVPGVYSGAALVWDSDPVSASPIIKVPEGRLGHFSTTYYWQVRYQDSRGLWSAYSEEWSFTTEDYPEKPSNKLPADGETGVSLTPELQGSKYEDIDGDPHVASKWQIRSTTGTYEKDSAVWDSEDAAATTSIVVPSGKLAYSTTYYWRVGYKQAGERYSPYSKEWSFTTMGSAAVAPTVSASAATGVGTTSATLNLSLNSLGSAPSVQVSFEWGLTTSYGNTTPATALTTVGSFSDNLSGLTLSTTYHFRAKAVGDVTAYGDDLTFTTSFSPSTAPTVTTVPPGQPACVEPTSEATGVSLSPTLASSAFSDPDAVSVHSASQWQITTAPGDYSGGSLVWDSAMRNSDLTRVDVPSGTLTHSTTYYWHVRHLDDRENWSEWSTEASFRTVDRGSRSWWPAVPAGIVAAGLIAAVAWWVISRRQAKKIMQWESEGYDLSDWKKK